MLAIRMQRTGRKGHAMFRVVVQDARRTPTSGKVVAALGSYDPHAKTIILDKEKASFYLEHGAQPSDRVARLLKAEGVKLPGWAKLESGKKGAVRNAEKRRSTRPEEPKVEEPAVPAEPAATAEAGPAPEAEASAPSENPTSEATEVTNDEELAEKIAEVEVNEEAADTAVNAEAEKIVEEAAVEADSAAQEAPADIEPKAEEPEADKK